MTKRKIGAVCGTALLIAAAVVVALREQQSVPLPDVPVAQTPAAVRVKAVERNSGWGRVRLQDVEAVRNKVQERLDGSFLRVRIERLTKSEKDFLFAMAQVETSEIKISDVARITNNPVASLSPRRSSLIKKGMVYSPSHGEIAFTVPMFGEYLNRVK